MTFEELMLKSNEDILKNDYRVKIQFSSAKNVIEQIHEFANKFSNYQLTRADDSLYPFTNGVVSWSDESKFYSKKNFGTYHRNWTRPILTNVWRSFQTPTYPKSLKFESYFATHAYVNKDKKEVKDHYVVLVVSGLKTLSFLAPVYGEVDYPFSKLAHYLDNRSSKMKQAKIEADTSKFLKDMLSIQIQELLPEDIFKKLVITTSDRSCLYGSLGLSKKHSETRISITSYIDPNAKLSEQRLNVGISGNYIKNLSIQEGCELFTAMTKDRI